MNILVVCTANQCRSPMAEALLRHRLEERGVAAEVGSGGFLAAGAPPTEPAIETMAAVGFDIAGHRSRQVSAHLLEEADLVVAMTRQHLIELTLMSPETWPRMFQLRDLVRRAEQTGGRRPGQSVAEWLAEIGQGRTRSGILAANQSDDVADPVGQSGVVYERTKHELDDLVTRLAAHL